MAQRQASGFVLRHAQYEHKQKNSFCDPKRDKGTFNLAKRVASSSPEAINKEGHSTTGLSNFLRKPFKSLQLTWHES
jgi:hypothetical protein